MATPPKVPPGWGASKVVLLDLTSRRVHAATGERCQGAARKAREGARREELQGRKREELQHRRQAGRRGATR